MKKHLFLLWLISCFTTCIFGQVYNRIDTGSRIGHHRSYVFFINGVLFNPLSEDYNMPDSSVSFCNVRKETVIMNGLILTKEKFTNLALKAKNIEGKKKWALLRRICNLRLFATKSYYGGEGVYYFTYRDLNSLSCVEKITFEVNTLLPIVLNGKCLAESEQKDILSKISSDKILSIESKTSVFLSRRIEIRIKSD